jgi:3-hydroxybutyryl-CoA dehydrogenase
MPIAHVGVIGAGVIGTGVAQDLAEHGIAVVLVDLTDAILAQARQTIRNQLRMQVLFGRSGGDDPDATLQRIALTTDHAPLADCAFIIENVVERWPVKEAVYRGLAEVCPSEAVFGANTSAIPITRIGAVSGRPDRVVGMHFMNPVPMKKTIEVVRGAHTSDATLATAQGLLGQLDKTALVVNDGPGFVANRLSHLFMNEAANLVLEQVADAKAVDAIFKQCYGHAMGPLETADLIGLDTVVDTLKILYDDLQDPRYRCSPLLRRMVDAGRLGQKSGQGFYPYSGAGRPA